MIMEEDIKKRLQAKEEIISLLMEYIPESEMNEVTNRISEIEKEFGVE